MYIKLTNKRGQTLKVKYSLNNIHIYRSCEIPKADMMDWIKLIREHGVQCGYTYSRSDGSWYREWKAHNLLANWGIELKRTEEVDLGETESVLRRVSYTLLSILYI